MKRISGVNLQEPARIEYALTKVFGIGPTRSKAILTKVKVSPDIRVKDLSDEDLKSIQQEVETIMVEGDLREELRQAINRLREAGSYRGIRHTRGLPARGQRTRSNARTRRGKRMTVGSFKKEDMVKMQQNAQKK